MRSFIGIALLLAAQTALAVRQGEVSTTAESTCLFRAIAAQHPDPKLRNPDDIAHKLCRSRMQMALGYADARRQIDSMAERYATYFYVNARIHYISDGKPDGRMIDWHRLIEARVP